MMMMTRLIFAPFSLIMPGIGMDYSHFHNLTIIDRSTVLAHFCSVKHELDCKHPILMCISIAIPNVRSCSLIICCIGIFGIRIISSHSYTSNPSHSTNTCDPKLKTQNSPSIHQRYTYKHV
ncbi:hypothetical protein DFP73DRAFT_304830 [Morchella snyderi]|nr:hypothetical protein DFP73DRAFT_304830 [Morchella snyderi]